jgi:release factor glutamine methyltransferase
MTVLEVIKRSSEYLEKRGVESPRLQIELLLAHVLKLPRLKLYLDFERRLSEHELDTVRTLVKRRGDREPLQYILGVTSFCGIELEVSPAVLIPRPETELLVEQAWNFLRQCAKPDPGILDFATGSGCIAIAVAAKFPQAFVAAIDISEPALAVARANAERNKTRVEFHCSGDFAPAGQREYDLIVSNPPYIPTSELVSLQPEVRDHEPRLALDGGADGLEFHRLIARESPGHLAQGGKLMVELGFAQAQAAEEVYAKEGWGLESVLPDYSGCARILIAHRQEW